MQKHRYFLSNVQYEIQLTHIFGRCSVSVYINKLNNIQFLVTIWQNETNFKQSIRFGTITTFTKKVI